MYVDGNIATNLRNIVGWEGGAWRACSIVLGIILVGCILIVE